MMKRPHFWREHRQKEEQPVLEKKPEALPPRTYQFTPRGDLDAFVKFFSGDMRKPGSD